MILTSALRHKSADKSPEETGVDRADLEWGLRSFYANKLPGDAGTASFKPLTEQPCLRPPSQEAAASLTVMTERF